MLSRSFEKIPEGSGARRQVVRAVTALGATAVPLLTRMFANGEPRQVAWARTLLEQVGSSRALSALRELGADERVSPECRTRTHALLR